MKEIKVEINKNMGGVIIYPEKWSQAEVIDNVMFALYRMARSGSHKQKKIDAIEQAAKRILMCIENQRMMG